MDQQHRRGKAGHLKRLRKSFPGLLIESLLITFGVLLAFAADNWKAQMRLEKDTRQVLHNLQNELIGNRSVVLEWHAYYDSLGHKVERVMANPSRSPKLVDADWLAALYPEPTVGYLPQETAWQTAQSTQVLRNFAYNTTYQLTHSYRYQRDIEKTRQFIFQVLYRESDDGTVRNRLSVLKGLYRELTQQQQYLLGTYRDALIALDQELISRKD